ncbi:MAG TPA: hypothetical protein VJ998_01355 [Pseudomonadales bacterium]|nr:hypothetical protein [Pseudomonadales bacterium]
MHTKLKTTCIAAIVSLLMSPVAALAKPGDMYVYPAKGQSNDQLEKDRYECYLWASKETGFDPTNNESRTQQAKVVRVPVQNEKQGATLAGTVIGAIAGAAIGAGDRHDHGQAAVAGAAVGTMIGATVEQQGQVQAQQQAQDTATQIAQEQQAQTQGMENYRRAFSACLEGRGYVVK